MFKFSSPEQAYVTLTAMIILTIFVIPILCFFEYVSFESSVVALFMASMIANHARSGLQNHTVIFAFEKLESLIRGNKLRKTFTKENIRSQMDESIGTLDDMLKDKFGDDTDTSSTKVHSGSEKEKELEQKLKEMFKDSTVKKDDQ